MASTFLFDKERSGRLPFKIGNLAAPKKIWEVFLPQYPGSGPEATAVLDSDGNSYFGCHNGCIYSLDPQGNVRWQFTTRNKVYASPLLHQKRLYFCCNSADVICLSLEGKLLWSFEGFGLLRKTSRPKKMLNHLISYLFYDYHDKSLNVKKITAWGSPNLLNENLLVVNLYGIGVVALDVNSGKQMWVRSLGVPWYNLSGVAIFNDKGKEFIAAVSQSNAVFVIDSLGNVVWERKLVFGWNSWSNPSVDSENNTIYCTTSKGNAKGWVFNFDYQGNLLWKSKVPTGIRGSVSISKDTYILIPGLNGILYFLSKSEGKIIREMKIAHPVRGLWTSAAIDSDGFILINAKTKSNDGSLIKINGSNGEVLWSESFGKALAVPTIDAAGIIYTGTWNNNYLKLQS